MKVRALGNRVFQIYICTILIGTLIYSLLMSIFYFESLLIITIFLPYSITAGLISLPNSFILNLGLKYIYKNANNEEEKRNYFIYLWLGLSIIPLLIVGFIRFLEPSLFNVKDSLLIFPCIVSSLYFIFKINDKFDKIYHPDFNRKRETSIDILDDDF
jgi:hypothetical protein